MTRDERSRASPMTRDLLLESIRRDRARLDAAAGALTDAQRVAPVLDGGWSVKDVLAHISAWERFCADWLGAVALGETPERPEVQDGDATNSRVYDAHKDDALATVEVTSRASYTALCNAVERLSEAELADEQRFGWPTWRMIDGNSGAHYREHAEQIAAAFAGTPISDSQQETT